MNRVEYTCYTFLSFWKVVFWPEPASSWAEHHAMIFSRRLVEGGQLQAIIPDSLLVSQSQDSEWCYTRCRQNPNPHGFREEMPLGSQSCWMNGWFSPWSGGKNDSPGWWPFFLGVLDKWKLKFWFQELLPWCSSSCLMVDGVWWLMLLC